MSRIIQCLLILIVFSCDAQSEIVDPTSVPNENIELGSIAESGMDQTILNSLIDVLDADSFPTVHSVLLVKDEKLIFEEYYKGFNRNARHDLRSAGKSISNILMGIAVQKGFIKDENEYVLDVLPKLNIRNKSEMKKRMQLKHVMTMTDGLECNDCVTIFQNRAEPIEYLMSLPMANEPGSTWFYNDATPSLIEYIVMSKAQMSMVEFMRSELYEPLNIKLSNDFNINFLRPRDMAQLGMLYLNNGDWKGQQIVPQQWVEESTKKQTDLAPYGYFWWVMELLANDGETYSCFAARGNGGNDIFVFPDHNLVAVFTGDNFDANFSYNFRMLNEYILVALND